MNQAIELHDACLVSITNHGDAPALWFAPAYLHRSSGRPGVDPGTGWTQSAKLTILGASTLAPVTLPAEVSCGWLRIGEVVYHNVIPAEGTFDADIEFSAVLFAKDFTWRHEITIRGIQLTITLEGEPAYVEEFLPKLGPATQAGLL